MRTQSLSLRTRTHGPALWLEWMGRREGDAAQLRPFVSMSELTFHVPALFLPPLPPSFRKIETSHRGVRRLICRCSRNNSPTRERGQIVMGLMMCPTSRNFGSVSKYQNLNLSTIFLIQAKITMWHHPWLMVFALLICTFLYHFSRTYFPLTAWKDIQYILSPVC